MSLLRRCTPRNDHMCQIVRPFGFVMTYERPRASLNLIPHSRLTDTPERTLLLCSVRKDEKNLA
jgi:hypothetical protein